MKTIYVCSKGSQVVMAIDIAAIDDAKVVGAFLKLAGESGLLVDRVEPWEATFQDPVLTRQRQVEREQNRQPEIDFNKPAAAESGKGPAEMGEGFTCTYSGGCPHENKSCEGCEYAGSIFPKVEKPAEAQPEGEIAQVTEAVQSLPPEDAEALADNKAEVSAVTGEPAPTLAEEFTQSPFFKAAMEGEGLPDHLEEELAQPAETVATANEEDIPF